MGLVNGLLVAVLRYQPVIATLCTLFVLTGLTLKLAPTPAIAPSATGRTRSQDRALTFPGRCLTLGLPVIALLALKRTAYLRQLYAVGADDAAAYSAGVDVTAVRVVSYVLGGVLAAVGGLALTAIAQSGDATLGASTSSSRWPPSRSAARRSAPAAAAGCSARRSARPPSTLLQNLLAELQVSALWNPVLYGLVLLAGLVTGARVRSALQVRDGMSATPASMHATERRRRLPVAQSLAVLGLVGLCGRHTRRLHDARRASTRRSCSRRCSGWPPRDRHSSC